MYCNRFGLKIFIHGYGFFIFTFKKVQKSNSDYTGVRRRMCVPLCPLLGLVRRVKP